MDVMKKYAIFRCVFYLVLGLAMLIFPDTVVQIIIYILAAYAVISGIISLVSSRKAEGGSGSLVGGILLIALGVCLFLFYKAIASILPIFVGVMMILIGIAQLAQAFGARQYTGKLNVFQLILGLLVLVGGVVGVLNPFGSLIILFRVFGALTLIMAVNEFSLFLTLRKAGKTE